MVLRKKETFTTITPIPGLIPRQLAIDLLHSHSEILAVNPLVIGHEPIQAPRNAQADEYYSTWYEISQRIQYVPGIGKIGSGNIKFNGCFHDLPGGLQTHIYAPMSVDLRHKYTIGGNQPGVEPPQHQEIGLGAPADGLYLREDIEIRCNISLVAIVKSQLKAASKEMISRMIKKAELLDAGVLHAMIEDGKIKTINPADRSFAGGRADSIKSPPLSPALPYNSSPGSPQPYQVPRPVSLQPPPLGQRPDSPGSQGYPQQWQQGQKHHVAELHSENINPSAVVMELPGDMYHAPPPAGLQPQAAGAQRDSIATSTQSRSPDPNAWRWSHSQGQPSPSFASRPTSYSSEGSAAQSSPGIDNKGFSSDLPTHNETSEEHRGYKPAGAAPQPPHYAYGRP